MSLLIALDRMKAALENEGVARPILTLASADEGRRFVAAALRESPPLTYEAARSHVTRGFEHITLLGFVVRWPTYK